MGGRGGSSHRRTGGGLSSLATTAQVSDWIRRQHWFRPYALVNLDGVDVVAAREIAAAYQQVFDRYPQLIGAFSGVKSFDLGKQYGGMVCGSLCRRHAFKHAAPYGGRIDEGTG